MSPLRKRGAECPHCFESNDASTAIKEGEHPLPGAISICAYCQGVSIFADDLNLRKPTLREIAGIRKNPYVKRIIKSLKKNPVRRV